MLSYSSVRTHRHQRGERKGRLNIKPGDVLYHTGEIPDSLDRFHVMPLQVVEFDHSRELVMKYRDGNYGELVANFFAEYFCTSSMGHMGCPCIFCGGGTYYRLVSLIPGSHRF